MEPGVKAAVAKMEKIQNDTKNPDKVCRPFNPTKSKVLAMASLVGMGMGRCGKMIQSLDSRLHSRLVVKRKNG